MANQAKNQGPGPGNKVIVTTLLESLAVRGRMAAHARAHRGLESSDIQLAEAAAWLPSDAVRDVLVAGDVDAALARSVGHRLVAPDVTGIALYALGIGTPEKAYRRVQSLLPRDKRAGDLVRRRNRSRKRPDCLLSTRQTTEQPFALVAKAPHFVRCARECSKPFPRFMASCRRASSKPVADRAAPKRVATEMSWQRSLRTGVLSGAAFGFVIGLAGVFVSSIAMGLGGIALCIGFGATIGRCFDLHRQLEAVAGGRRGHLALFDQVDDALASKLDALARVDAKLEGDEFAYRPDRTRPESEGVEDVGGRRSRFTTRCGRRDS